MNGSMSRQSSPHSMIIDRYPYCLSSDCDPHMCKVLIVCSRSSSPYLTSPRLYLLPYLPFLSHTIPSLPFPSPPLPSPPLPFLPLFTPSVPPHLCTPLLTPGGPCTSTTNGGGSSALASAVGACSRFCCCSTRWLAASFALRDDLNAKAWGTRKTDGYSRCKASGRTPALDLAGRKVHAL